MPPSEPTIPLSTAIAAVRLIEAERDTWRDLWRTMWLDTPPPAQKVQACAIGDRRGASPPAIVEEGSQSRDATLEEMSDAHTIHTDV